MYMSELEGFLYTETSLWGSFDYILEKLIKEDGKGVYKHITLRTPDNSKELSPFRKIEEIIDNSDKKCVKVDLSVEEYLSLWYSKCGDWITPFLLKYRGFCRSAYVLVNLIQGDLYNTVNKVLNYIDENKID